jgi:predicted short-subunit dehydrogenase-like oxidoreductase (DUF2520 family)
MEPDAMTAVHSVLVVGRGRAGGSFAAALGARGWQVELQSAQDAADPADADLVLICVPDAAVASVASGLPPTDAVVAHVSGSLGLDVLAPHERRASIHPLVALPNPEVGAARLGAGANFAVAGHPMAREVVTALGGTAIEVPDEHRAAYHAAACVASNHLVALLGQAERVAAQAGVPLRAFEHLVRGTVDNVFTLGPAAALTGPAARGDETTLQRHRAVLDRSELVAYDAMVDLCRRLAQEGR